MGDAVGLSTHDSEIPTGIGHPAVSPFNRECV